MWALAPEGRPFKLAHDFRLLKLQVGLRAHCYHYPVTDPAPTAIPRHLTTVFLDRDGVLNKKMPEPRYVASWADFHILPGVPDAIARLNRAGLRVIVLSNQRGIALGLYTAADVEAIHSAFQRILSSNGAHIDAFFICPHDRGQCNCRKPLPGLPLLFPVAGSRKRFTGYPLGLSPLVVVLTPGAPGPASGTWDSMNPTHKITRSET